MPAVPDATVSSLPAFAVGTAFATTVKVALVVPLLPRFDVNAPEVFEFPPTLNDVTSAVTVQLAPIPTLAPDRVTELAVLDSVPPAQVFDTLTGVVIVTPAGKLLVNAKVVADWLAVPFVMVKVAVETPFCTIELGEKAMLKLGGVTLMVTLSLAALATSKPLSDSAEVVFVRLPAVVVTPVAT